MQNKLSEEKLESENEVFETKSKLENSVDAEQYPISIKNLLDDLQNGSARKRRAAAYKLGYLKNPVAIPALIEATKSEDLILRQNASNAIREIKAGEGPLENYERFWAMIAHFCILPVLLAVVPVLLPLFIYLWFKNKSEFIASHSLQAFTYQLVYALPMAIIYISFDPDSLNNFMMGFVYCLCVIYPLMLLFGFDAGMKAWHGKSYKYPFIG